MQNNQDRYFLARVYSDLNEQSLKDEVPEVAVPAHLGRKLRQIPQTAKKNAPSRQRFLWAGSLAASLVLACVLYGYQQYDTRTRVLQVQQDLRITVAYLRKANQGVSDLVEHKVVDDSLGKISEAIRLQNTDFDYWHD